MSEPQLHLIIQGPLLSVNENKPFGESIYDCRPCVARIVNEYQHLFRSMTLVTWENQPALVGLPQLQSYYIKDAQRGVKKYYGYGRVYIDNKKKMWHGIDYALRKNPYLYQDVDAYIIKIRTDQYLDLELIADFLSLVGDEILKRRIFVPFFSYRKDQIALSEFPSAFLSDYYVFASAPLFFKFIRSQIKPYRDLTRCVHSDSFYRYVAHMFPALYKDQPLSFKIQNGYLYHQTKEPILQGYCNCFYPLPKSAFATLEWRGAKIADISDSYDGKIFFSDWQDIAFQSRFYGLINSRLSPRLDWLSRFYAFERPVIRRLYGVKSKRVFYSMQRIAHYYVRLIRLAIKLLAFIRFRLGLVPVEC